MEQGTSFDGCRLNAEAPPCVAALATVMTVSGNNSFYRSESGAVKDGPGTRSRRPPEEHLRKNTDFTRIEKRSLEPTGSVGYIDTKELFKALRNDEADAGEGGGIPNRRPEKIVDAAKTWQARPITKSTSANRLSQANGGKTERFQESVGR